MKYCMLIEVVIKVYQSGGGGDNFFGEAHAYSNEDKIDSERAIR